MKLDDQISTQRLQEESFPLILLFRVVHIWDIVQIKVTDRRYACPLMKAHGMVSIEKDFELACFLVQDLVILMLFRAMENL